MLRCSVCHQALQSGLAPHHKAMQLAIGTPIKQTAQHLKQHASSASHVNRLATLAALQSDVRKASSIRTLMPKELRQHLLRMIINLMVILKQGRPISDYVVHAKADTKKGLEYGFQQHSRKYAWRIADAAELVLNISLKSILSSATVACLMVDATTKRLPKYCCGWCTTERL